MFTIHISQVIEMFYKHWHHGNYIFITASTGTGKTYFILHILYEYAVQNDYPIVILVNRKILKQQLLHELRQYDAKMGRTQCQIQIFTYQELEAADQNGWKYRCLHEAYFVICDEAHYFRADATFNPGTAKSFDLIMGLIPEKIVVFMTATPIKVKQSIIERIEADYRKKMEDWKGAEALRKQRNEEIKDELCRYREDGSEYNLLEFGENLENYDGSHLESENALEPGSEPNRPELIEYSLHRNLRKHIVLHFFNGLDDLTEIITGNSYKGKWLIFVSSKRIGRKLYTALAEHFENNKKTIFIDADYGLKGHERAMDEVSEIIQKGRLAADILICTSVLDNGISIHDPKLCNVVIMTDDEVEFLQMLGRKRLDSENEKFHLFLTGGNVSYFQRREADYCNWYWQLCENMVFPASDVYPLVTENSLTIHDIGNCYNQESNVFHVNPLAIEEINSKYIFYAKMSKQLTTDPYAFLKEQIRWLDFEHSDDLFIRQNIHYSQKDVDTVTSELEKIRTCKGGLITKTQLENLKPSILSVATVIDSSYERENCNLTTLNAIFQSLPEWKPYQFLQITLEKQAHYELVFEKQNCISIDGDRITLDCLREIISQCPDAVNEECFKSITGNSIPACLANDSKKINALLNEKMKSVPHLRDYIIKNQSGSNLQVVRRPSISKPAT